MSLRIAINLPEHRGPFGGGTQFVNALEGGLRSRGHEVFRQLAPDLDVILLVGHRQSSFDIPSVLAYRLAYPSATVVHRVNDSDLARGGGDAFTRAVFFAQRAADHTIFVSDFIRNHYVGLGFDAQRPHSVIHNGADERTFHPQGRAEWRHGEPIRVVTHHWSSNYLKGFDVYERFDQLLESDAYNKRFSFTCIGNRPAGVTMPSSLCEPVSYGDELAGKLRAHHLYLSAARHEAGGNHYIEALQCGLPVLYLESGSLPEYCAPFGLGFRLAGFGAALEACAERLPHLRENVLSCRLSASASVEAYLGLFETLAAERRRMGLRPAISGCVQYNMFKARRRLGSLRRNFCALMCERKRSS